MCEALAGLSGVCLEVQSDPDVSALLRRKNRELVDHCDSHTHTKRKPPQGSPYDHCTPPTHSWHFSSKHIYRFPIHDCSMTLSWNPQALQKCLSYVIVLTVYVHTLCCVYKFVALLVFSSVSLQGGIRVWLNMCVCVCVFKYYISKALQEKSITMRAKQSWRVSTLKKKKK